MGHQSLVLRGRARPLVMVALMVGFVVIPACGQTGTALASVDTRATPSGWVPLDYGDAQVSVPSTWVIGKLDCPGLFPSSGWVSLGGITQLSGCPAFELYPPTNSISIESESGAPVSRASPAKINGLSVFREVSGTPYVVPALGVTISVTGPLSGQMLDTLTYSPRAVVLAPGPSASVPSSWHRVSFGGLSVEVPRSWPTRAGAWEGSCNPTVLLAPNQKSVVTTDAGNAQSGPPSCPSSSSLKIEQPREGLVIDPGPYGPIPSGSTFAACIKVNGLSICPTTPKAYYPAVPATIDAGGVLVASVHPGKDTPVAIEIGLAGDGQTARTILHSVRPN